MGCKYVKDFEFGGKSDQKYAKGGPAKNAAVAVHKHEKAMHKGEPLTKLKRGGPVAEKATGEKYPSREAMVRHEAKETPRMQREELVQRSKVVSPARPPAQAPVRRSVPVASRAPLIAMKTGGKVSGPACGCKAGK